MRTADSNVLPSSPNSILHHSAQPMTTVLASPLSQRSAIPDLENLFGDATFQAQSMTQSNTRSSQWTVQTGPNKIPTTYVHQPSAAEPQSTSTQSDNGNLGALYQGLPRDAKIGIIVGIVAIVSLSLLGCGMCFLDCRRRQRKRKERRRSREAELVMLETEMRNGQADQQRRARKGLWDHLKPASGNGVVNVTEVADAEGRHAAMKPNPRDGRKDSTVESSRSHSVASPSPVIPRDRASIVSSARSFSSSVGTRPAPPRSFLDSGARS